MHKKKFMVVESITHILKITPDLSDIDYRQPKNDFVPSANKMCY